MAQLRRCLLLLCPVLDAYFHWVDSKFVLFLLLFCIGVNWNIRVVFIKDFVIIFVKNFVAKNV